MGQLAVTRFGGASVWTHSRPFQGLTYPAMSQDHFDRKDLTHDPLQEWFFETYDYVQKRIKLFILGGLGVVVVVVAVGGYIGYTRYTDRVDSEEYLKAERVLQDPALAQDARLKKGSDAFRVFVEQHPRSALAPAAWLTVARLAWEQKQWDQAADAFQHVVDSRKSSPLMRTQALLGLGKAKEQQGKPAEAKAFYEKISDDFSDVKQLALGRAALADGDLKGAREHFLQAAAGQPSSISLQAKEALDALPQ